MLSVRVEDNGLAEYMKDLPDDVYIAARRVFANSVLAADAEIKDNATHKIEVRTGALRRSIQSEVNGFSLSTLKASVFSGPSGRTKPIAYAPIHEEGGTVKAKNAYTRVPGGPYLNVPVADNLTPAGVMRMTPGMVFKQGGHLTKSKKGRWLVFLDDRLMFVLIKSVTIKPQLGMRKAADKQVGIILSELQALIGED